MGRIPAILAFLAAAGAAAEGRILVLDAVPIGVPENVSAHLTELVRVALEEQRADLALDRQAFAVVLSHVARKLEPKLLRKLESGRDAYFAGDSREARDHLEPLRAELEARVLKMSDFDPLLDCYRLLAATYFDLKTPEKADDLVKALVRLRPDQAPDTTLFPGSFGRAFKKELETASRRGALSVESEPPGASLYLDGRLLGQAPKEARDLAPGPHYLRLEAQGRTAYTRVVEVPAGAEVEVVAEMPPTPASEDWAKLKANLTAAGPRPEAELLAASLAKAAEADEAMLLAVVGLKGGVFLAAARLGGDAAPPRAWTLLTPDLTGAGKATGQLVQALLAPPSDRKPARVEAAPLLVDPPPDFEARLLGYAARTTEDPKYGLFPALTAVPPPPEAPYYTQWWFWTGVGALVAGGAVTLLVITGEPPAAVPDHVDVTVVLP